MFKNTLLAAAIILLTACTSFQENEFRGEIPANPITTLRIHLKDVQVSNVQLLTATQLGVPGNFNRAREKASSEIPRLQVLLRQGIKTDLAAALSKYVSIEDETAPSNQTHILYLEPSSGSVECGSGNVICQASIRISVHLMDGGGGMLWKAGYKVGAPMLGSNDAEVMKKFFNDVVSRLEDQKIIKTR